MVAVTTENTPRIELHPIKDEEIVKLLQGMINFTRFQVHGTTNCFICLKDRTLFGVDGKGSICFRTTLHDSSTAGLVPRPWATDTALKFYDMNVGVCATLCGNYHMCEKVLEYLLEELYWHDLDFTQLRELTLTYMAKHPVEKGFSGRVFLMAGKDPEGYRVYDVRDGLDGPSATPVNKIFHAIGSGAGFAMLSLEKENIHTNMTETAAKDCINRALLAAAVSDPGSGGLLRVYSHSHKAKNVNNLSTIHAMDLLLQTPQPDFFGKDKLFYIVQKKDILFTPEDLFRVLNGNHQSDRKVRFVHCIAEAGSERLLYRAEFKSERLATLELGRGVTVHGSLRKREFLFRMPQPQPPRMTTVTTYVDYASVEMLRKSRKMTLIASLA